MVTFLEVCRANRKIKIIFSSRPHLYTLGKAFNDFTLEVEPHREDILALIKGRIKEDEHLQMIIGGDSTWAGRVAAKILHKSAGQ